MTNKLKNSLNLNDKTLQLLAEEFTNSEKRDIVKQTLIGVINGKTKFQAIKDISNGNFYLLKRNLNKFNRVMTFEKELILTSLIDILKEKIKILNGYNL